MRAFLQVASAALLLLLSTSASTFAGSATWTGATDGNWDTLTNWTTNPNPVPDGPSDVATFDTSGNTSISLPTSITLDRAVFNPGASAYTITANPGPLDFQGTGVVNNSGITQNFATGASSSITFENSATAGSMTAYSNSGSMNFSNTSTADNATITNTGAGGTFFIGSASGGNATLVNSGASSFFDFSGLTNGGTTAGSIAGNGAIYLGANTLTVGSNDTSTTFSGAIQDGPNGYGGNLTKVGLGTLTLTGANTYKGETIVSGGTLDVAGGSLSSDFNFSVGKAGTGALNITNGAAVSVYTSFIGVTGGTGTATVDGFGSGATWTSGNSIFVGEGAGATGTLNVINGGAVNVDSDVIVGDGGGTGTMHINSGGTLSNFNGFVGDTGTGTATVDGVGSTWTNAGNFKVGEGGGSNGTLHITNGGTVSTSGNTIIGDVGTGTVTVDGAGSKFKSSSFVRVSDGGTGTLTVTNGGQVLSPSVEVNQGGLLTGTGFIKGNEAGDPSLVTNSGVVSPGDGATLGTLHLIGSYVQTSGGTFSITIGSLAFYDALEMSGTAMLDGTLSVALANGYTINPGDVFTILSSTGLGGTNFTTINLPSIGNGLFFTESTDANNVYLTVNQAAVPEPATWAATLLTAGTLLCSFRRRRAVVG
jgi:T5SS/PEP-CTERM-associated repeat protein/autotransporter-associated beta strand protein